MNVFAGDSMFQVGVILTQGREISAEHSTGDGVHLESILAGEWVTSDTVSLSNNSRIWNFVEDHYGDPKVTLK